MLGTEAYFLRLKLDNVSKQSHMKDLLIQTYKDISALQTICASRSYIPRTFKNVRT